MAHQTLPLLFESAVRRFGPRPAVRNARPIAAEPVEVTYAELDALVARLASGLQGLGIGKNDRIALVSRPRIRFAVVALAAFRLGAWLVPIDPSSTAEELERLVDHARPKALFAETEWLDRCPSSIPHRVDLDDGSDGRFSDLVLDADPSSVEIVPDDIAVLAYTSGTTGQAKGVMLSHGNIVADLVNGTQVIPVFPDDVFLAIAPWHHILGLVACLILPLYGGAVTMYTDEYRRIAELMRGHGVSIFVGVPKLYHGLYAKLMEKVDSSLAGRLLWRLAPRLVGKKTKKSLTGGRLRFMVSGSAPLDPAVALGFRRMGIGMMEGYGLTETSPVISVSDPFGKKPGSVGRPLPGVEARIRDPWPDGVGELLIRGPIVMRGYYENPEATASAIDDEGWLSTGDLATLDADGEIFLHGRAKNVIVLDSGKNVYPEELEWEIGRIPYVEEVLVRPQAEGGGIEAVVYPNEERLSLERAGRPAREVLWEEIRSALKRVAPHKRLRSIRQLILVNRPFPKTSTLDIKRHLFDWHRTDEKHPDARNA